MRLGFCSILVQLRIRAPPLKSISGQTLNMYGRKHVAFEIEGQRFVVELLCL